MDDLEKIRPYEPNVVKAAWNIFGASYRYREKYNAYKKERQAAEKAQKSGNTCLDGQLTMEKLHFL